MPVSATFADGTGHGKLTTMNMRGIPSVRYERNVFTFGLSGLQIVGQTAHAQCGEGRKSAGQRRALDHADDSVPTLLRGGALSAPSVATPLTIAFEDGCAAAAAAYTRGAPMAYA
jgi:hypothetical protein